MDALIALRLPGGQATQLVLFIIRRTIGWNKKRDKISLSQIQKATGIPKHKIIEIRKKLVNMNIITITQEGNAKTLTYGFNSHYKLWKPLPKKVTITQEGNGITQEGKKPLPKKVPTKNIIKDTSSKDNITTLFIEQKFKEFIEIYPNAVAKDKAWEAWQQLFVRGYAGKRCMTKFLTPLTEELFQTIIGSIKAQIEEREWKRKAKIWMAPWSHPASWLRAKRWEDKVEKEPVEVNEFL